jgi:hypothetical protein
MIQAPYSVLVVGKRNSQLAQKLPYSILLCPIFQSNFLNNSRNTQWILDLMSATCSRNQRKL